MHQNEKNLSLRILMLITSPKLAKKATNMFYAGSVPTHYQLHAKGTASSDMLDIMGLGSIDKTMLLSIMPKPFSDEMLRKVKKELKLGIPGNGIAFTIPLSGANTLIFRMLEQLMDESFTLPERKDETAMTDIKYTMIAAVINQGYSEEVMNAARNAGAGGGTILHCRRIGDEQAMKFWGLSIQEEKEIVLIVSDMESKLKIMKAIGEKCGIHSEAKGIVVSLPIDAVIGLNDGE